MIVADVFENATPFQLNLHKGKMDETLFVKRNLQASFILAHTIKIRFK